MVWIPLSAQLDLKNQRKEPTNPIVGLTRATLTVTVKIFDYVFVFLSARTFSLGAAAGGAQSHGKWIKIAAVALGPESEKQKRFHT